ncbi:MAG: hypothetical protein HQ508_08590 [Candidatus Marinimicrobia bacterium]|nr:hypothetical protein [Candidatus Neomarinimicrobiota bacterium]
MSLYAAIGYVLGIMIFALFIRRSRKRRIDSHNIKAKHNKSVKGNLHD